MKVRSRREMIPVVVGMLFALNGTAFASRCADRACSPPIGNLASGRTLTTLAGCCGDPGPPRSPSPRPRAKHACPADTHPPSHMADDPFSHPDTWWASAAAGTGAGPARDEIRLDLETHFCLSHVVLLFRSPRPAAMAVERSADFGRTWDTLKLFAHNCSLEFGFPDDVSQPDSPCTSRYSRAAPCSGGEVILRTLSSGSVKPTDPYSPESLARLRLTNLRIRLLKAHTCHAPPDPPQDGRRPPPSPPTLGPPTQGPGSAPYAIYTLLAGGTCLCHGHAELCLPVNGSRVTPQESSAVPGRCVCTHHTAGEHCERCAPLYNDRPWRPANGSSGAPNPCQKCECHGHADSCHFSPRAWLSSGGTSGGVCDDCRHDTTGRRCQRCRPGYHRHPSLLLASPHACIRCWCDPQGSLSFHHGEEGARCHPRSGQCHCKAGVGGVTCSYCLPGYWGFGDEGCKPCACPCDPNTGHCPQTCDPNTGHCPQTCDPNTGHCPQTCDPNTGHCPQTCDPNTGDCPQTCDPNTGHCLDSYANNQVFNVAVGGIIPDLEYMFTTEGEAIWPKQLAVSTLRYTGKCSCKERKLRSMSDLCKSKQDYVIKASVLSAHDKGTHAEVQVKVRKVLRSGRVPLTLGTINIYPLTWTSLGCTCPILNPGMDYLLAGPEDPETGRLLVTLQSVVVLWTPRLGLHLSHGLRQGCQ